LTVRSQAPAPIRTALVLGGGSDIAAATLPRFAALGLERVVLAVRRPDAVAAEQATALEASPDLAVSVLPWDAGDVTAHDVLVRDAGAILGEIDLVLCAVGMLGHHAGLGMSATDVDEMIRVNFAGAAAALAAASTVLVEQGRGTIIVLSSVAGVRPRRSNYVYGSSKSGLDAFALGLGDAVRSAGVNVIVMRPGFVRSKMTTGLPPAPFATDPDTVAAAIVAAAGKGRHGVVWVPPVLGPLFGVLRIVPAPVWRVIAGDR
jgi:NAD(P)-dependent dehydrogenase (short-subunit alcohol dehydrogenase family)